MRSLSIRAGSNGVASRRAEQRLSALQTVTASARLTDQQRFSFFNQAGQV
jgi:hypothetical protein